MYRTWDTNFSSKSVVSELKSALSVNNPLPLNNTCRQKDIGDPSEFAPESTLRKLASEND